MFCIYMCYCCRREEAGYPSISPYKCTMAVEEILRPYYCHRGNIIICVCIYNTCPSIYKGLYICFFFRKIIYMEKNPEKIINVLSVCERDLVGVGAQDKSFVRLLIRRLSTEFGAATRLLPGPLKVH